MTRPPPSTSRDATPSERSWRSTSSICSPSGPGATSRTVAPAADERAGGAPDRRRVGTGSRWRRRRTAPSRVSGVRSVESRTTRSGEAPGTIRTVSCGIVLQHGARTDEDGVAAGAHGVRDPPLRLAADPLRVAGPGGDPPVERLGVLQDDVRPVGLWVAASRAGGRRRPASAGSSVQPGHPSTGGVRTAPAWCPGSARLCRLRGGAQRLHRLDHDAVPPEAVDLGRVVRQQPHRPDAERASGPRPRRRSRAGRHAARAAGSRRRCRRPRPARRRPAACSPGRSRGPRGRRGRARRRGPRRPSPAVPTAAGPRSRSAASRGRPR